MVLQNMAMDVVILIIETELMANYLMVPGNIRRMHYARLQLSLHYFPMKMIGNFMIERQQNV